MRLNIDRFVPGFRPMLHLNRMPLLTRSVLVPIVHVPSEVEPGDLSGGTTTGPTRPLTPTGPAGRGSFWPLASVAVGHRGL